MDFGEVWVVLNGVITKCHKFFLRLSQSGKAIHRSVDRTTGVSSA